MRTGLCIFLMFSVLLKSAAGLAMQVQMASTIGAPIKVSALSKNPSAHTANGIHSEHTPAAMPCHTAHTDVATPSAWDGLMQATHSQCDSVCPTLFYVVPAQPSYALAHLVHTAPISQPFSVIMAPAMPPIKPPVV